LQPPIAFLEAKLGSQNISGVCEDVDRVMNLLAIYDDLNLRTSVHPYGAVVFHLMQEGSCAAKLQSAAAKLISAVTNRIAIWKAERPWLHSQCGLLTRAQVSEPVSGYEEHYPDGTSESVFAKESFSFAPGLVLLGPDPTIQNVQF
jgi:hypothetical protein